MSEDNKKVLSFMAAKLKQEIEAMTVKCGTEDTDNNNLLKKGMERHAELEQRKKKQRDKDNASLIARWNLSKHKGSGNSNGGGGGGGGIPPIA